MFSQRAGGGGGLSINTGAANTLSVPSTQPPSGGLFGNAAKPASTSLFGSSSAGAAPSAGTLFGASTSAPSTGSLFGTASSGASKAGTLFGGPAAANQSNAPANSGASTAGGLFGNPQSSQLQQTSSLFGSTTQQQPQQQQQQAGGGLFGSLGQNQNQNQNQSQTQQALGASLFGSLGQSQSAQPQQTQQGGGLFGSLGQSHPNNAPASNSLFGRSNAQSSIFQQTQRSLFTSSIGQYSAAQNTVPGVRIDLSNLRPTTRFNDLYEDLQKEIEALDDTIVAQMNLAAECEAAMPRVADSIAYVPTDVAYCRSRLDATQQALETDAGAIDAAKQKVRRDALDARRSFKAIHALRLPAQFQQGSLWNAPGALAQTSLADDGLDGDGTDVGVSSKDGATPRDRTRTDLVGYFAREAEAMDTRLTTMKGQLSEVESYLCSLETRAAQQAHAVRVNGGLVDDNGRTAEDQVRQLAAVLSDFEGGILNVAGNVGGVREAAQSLMLQGAEWRGLR